MFNLMSIRSFAARRQNVSSAWGNTASAAVCAAVFTINLLFNRICAAEGEAAKGYRRYVVWEWHMHTGGSEVCTYRHSCGIHSINAINMWYSNVTCKVGGGYTWYGL